MAIIDRQEYNKLRLLDIIQGRSCVGACNAKLNHIYDNKSIPYDCPLYINGNRKCRLGDLSFAQFKKTAIDKYIELFGIEGLFDEFI